MTQNTYEFELADPVSAEYWTKMVKCQDACPVHTNACGYVTAIAEGEYEKAFRRARPTRSFRFAGVCAARRVKPIAGAAIWIRRLRFAP
jgi:NADPH-dependent glutamate synthase beta subunit-like oxidoreductase